MNFSICLNGTRYTSLSALNNFPHRGAIQFLAEWFSPSPSLTGHTSGSTGIPKEIRLSKKDMMASARITNEYFEIDEQTNMLLCLSPAYIAGKMMLVRAILSGANLVVVSPSSDPLSHLPAPVDFAAMVPMQIETLLSSEASSKKFAEIRQVIIGGAPLSSRQEEKLQGFPTRCFGTYGMTETVSHVALRPLNGPQRSAEYFALGQVYFETDTRNCLVIHAPHLTNQTFVTNDVVRLRNHTHFEWLGRYDHVINSGGIKFFPEHIESKISPVIDKRFFITSEPDSRLGERMILVVEDSTWDTSRQESFQARLQELLSPYEIPKKIYFQPRLEETYSGKIIRKHPYHSSTSINP